MTLLPRYDTASQISIGYIQELSIFPAMLHRLLSAQQAPQH